MELATNLFTKGLQLDTHPMVLGNDTLIDCLNGTLITMNGNEVILLNDMGNRRVDSAFLPSGYEPVGMKEYGGIIYVAAYNPITNKSLIGSFPSPLKKIDSLDDPNLKGSFDFNSFLTGSNVEKDSDLGIDIMKTDSFMVPLTGDTSLRAGDKFAIYASGLSSLASDLTNYDNISGNKAYSPKNRKYTLQIGILNSQNEFVDITKTLCRWKSNIIQTYNEEKSDIFKFNDGYFISDEFTDKLSGSTIEDTKLIKKRLKMAANTYAYKLVGPMYLKANLNHIENFNYNIYGIYDDGKAILWIEGYLTYNCPDNPANLISNSNEDYYTFEEGDPGFTAFDLVGETVEETTIEKSIYSPNNNLYSTKLVKKFENITANDPDPTSTIYNYVLGVLADKDTPEIYLKGLSVKGLLDLALLGSGKVFLNGWRYYNNLSKLSTTLTFSFNAYPKYGEQFQNLKFTFTNINPNDNESPIVYPKEGGLPLYNGRQTMTINWSEEGINFKPRKLYEVTATYDIVNTSTGLPVSLNVKLSTTDLDDNGDPIRRWFLTTELFNEFYLVSAKVPDYCRCNLGLNKTDPNYNEDFAEKMVIKLTGNNNITNTSKKEETTTGSLTTTKKPYGSGGSEPNIEYQVEHTYDVNLLNDSQIIIINEDLYPDFITVKDSEKLSIEIKEIKLKFENLDELFNPNDSNINAKFISLLSEIKGGNLLTNTETTFKNKIFLDTSSLVIKNNNKTISGKISYYDILIGNGTTPIEDIENAFCGFLDVLEDFVPTAGYFGGLIPNFDSRGGLFGNDDGHFIDLARKQDRDYIEGLPSDDNLGEHWVRLLDEDDDDRVVFHFKNFSERVYNEFNSNSKAGLVFMYLFPSDSVDYTTYEAAFHMNGSSRKRGGTYARIWWKTFDGQWALFNDFKRRSESVKDFLKRTLKYEYVYCVWDQYLGSSSGVSSINIYGLENDYIYYDLYKIPLYIIVSYQLISEKTTEDVVEIPYANKNNPLGNLKFSVAENLDINSNGILFNLDSSLEFLDTINTFDLSSLSNIDISTGISKDTKGRNLNPNYIYYKKFKSDGVTVEGLVRLSSLPLKIDTENKVNDKNTLVYNRTTLSSPNPYRYESVDGGDEDSHTVLDYDNTVNLVTGV